MRIQIHRFEDIEYPYRITSFKGPRPEKPNSHPKWGCIISGFDSSKFVTNTTPNAIFDAIIAHDMPYKTRITFLLDLETTIIILMQGVSEYTFQVEKLIP